MTMTTHDGLPLSNNMCRICGDQPEYFKRPMTIGPIRYWDPDDGWIYGSLCFNCHREQGDARPHPDDYAYVEQRDEVITIIDTDEDYTGLLDVF